MPFLTKMFPASAVWCPITMLFFGYLAMSVCYPCFPNACVKFWYNLDLSSYVFPIFLCLGPCILFCPAMCACGDTMMQGAFKDHVFNVYEPYL